MAEAFGHGTGDGGGELAVGGVGEVEVLAVAVLVLLTVLHVAEGGGVLLGEPGGRCGGGGAEHDGDVVLFGEADGVVEPVEVVVAFGGLHAGPGELGDADEADVGLLHEGEVGVPAGLGPLLGIPGGAEVEHGGCARGCGCGDGDLRVREGGRGGGEGEGGDEEGAAEGHAGFLWGTWRQEDGNARTCRVAKCRGGLVFFDGCGWPAVWVGKLKLSAAASGVAGPSTAALA